jgi:hypothetical protein
MQHPDGAPGPCDALPPLFRRGIVFAHAQKPAVSVVRSCIEQGTSAHCLARATASKTNSGLTVKRPLSHMGRGPPHARRAMKVGASLEQNSSFILSLSRAWCARHVRRVVHCWWMCGGRQQQSGRCRGRRRSDGRFSNQLDGQHDVVGDEWRVLSMRHRPGLRRHVEVCPSRW